MRRHGIWTWRYCLYRSNCYSCYRRRPKKEQPFLVRTKFIAHFWITQKLFTVNYELELLSSYKCTPTSYFRISKTTLFRDSAQRAAQFRKYKDGSVEVGITAINDYKDKAKCFLILVNFSDNISEWICMNSLECTAGGILKEYCSKYSDLCKVFSYYPRRCNW